MGEGGGVDFTFIEPYPERLKSLLTPHDNVRIIEEKLQDVDTDIFSSLQAGDILFIDSTHVSKIDSDVNLYLFNILPRLAKGVLIHIHSHFPFFPVDLLSNSSLKRTNLPPSSSRTTVAS